MTWIHLSKIENLFLKMTTNYICSSLVREGIGTMILLLLLFSWFILLTLFPDSLPHYFVISASRFSETNRFLVLKLLSPKLKRHIFPLSSLGSGMSYLWFCSFHPTQSLNIHGYVYSSAWDYMITWYFMVWKAVSLK